jgi:hydroxyethylthiazole kinase-like uncharacterized protein yjeF
MRAPAVFTTAGIRELEERGAKAIGGGPTLMERAGAATARAAAALVPDNGAPILVVAGPGNNGGDAWVAAARLRESFHRVVVHDAAGASPRAPEAKAAVARFLELGGRTVPEWPSDLRPGLIVDGLLGIGLSRDVEGPLAALVGRINASGAPVLAIDIPSGIGSDTGRVRGIAVRATRTITFIARKAGLYTADALDHTGEIEVDALGIPATFFEAARGCLLTPGALRDWLAPRPRHSHKGTFGTVAIVGGSEGMTGAALLAGRAAALAGAGKTFVHCLSPHAPAFDPSFPELMLRPLEHSPGASVYVVGPGAGFDAGTPRVSPFERKILPELIALGAPLVLDADALNAIAASDGLKQALAESRPAPTLLTPHPAEAARLLGRPTESVQSDRLAAALELARWFRAEVVLKGAGSVCASPDGTWAINATGNPGLASGGTGDVLAGIAGALLAQGLAAPAALRLAVCLHGAAADSCVARGVGPIGLTASEVAWEARAVLNRWVGGS